MANLDKGNFISFWVDSPQQSSVARAEDLLPV
jgi:hypothetical protein